MYLSSMLGGQLAQVGLALNVVVVVATHVPLLFVFSALGFLILAELAQFLAAAESCSVGESSLMLFVGACFVLLYQ